MELSPQKSKVIKLSLLLLGAILLLLIGAIFGSHFSHYRSYGHNNRECFGPINSRFERGNPFEGRNGGRRFQMMAPQNADYQNQIKQPDSAKILNATGTQELPPTPNSVPVIK